MAGIYNPSITQRLNGLVEKQETKQDTNLKQSITVTVIKSPVPLSNKEIDIKE
jgi:hypothetical protein